MEADKRRLAGDLARSASSDEVRDLRKEARDLKEVVAEQMLDMALERSGLSRRELAVTFTDEQRDFVTEAGVSRIFKRMI